MKKILISGVSVFAIVAATNALGAGYTCEDLVQYTSCNPGYYLSYSCPDGYSYVTGACDYENGDNPASGYETEEECMNAVEEYYGDYGFGDYLGDGCLSKTNPIF